MYHLLGKARRRKISETRTIERKKRTGRPATRWRYPLYRDEGCITAFQSITTPLAGEGGRGKTNSLVQPRPSIDNRLLGLRPSTLAGLSSATKVRRVNSRELADEGRGSRRKEASERASEQAQRPGEDRRFLVSDFSVGRERRDRHRHGQSRPWPPTPAKLKENNCRVALTVAGQAELKQNTSCVSANFVNELRVVYAHGKRVRYMHTYAKSRDGVGQIEANVSRHEGKQSGLRPRKNVSVRFSELRLARDGITRRLARWLAYIQF